MYAHDANKFRLKWLPVRPKDEFSLMADQFEACI